MHPGMFALLVHAHAHAHACACVLSAHAHVMRMHVHLSMDVHAAPANVNVNAHDANAYTSSGARTTAGWERSKPAENLGAATVRGSKTATEGLGRTGGLEAAAEYEMR